MGGTSKSALLRVKQIQQLLLLSFFRMQLSLILGPSGLQKSPSSSVTNQRKGHGVFSGPMQARNNRHLPALPCCVLAVWPRCLTAPRSFQTHWSSTRCQHQQFHHLSERPRRSCLLTQAETRQLHADVRAWVATLLTFFWGERLLSGNIIIDDLSSWIGLSLISTHSWKTSTHTHTHAKLTLLWNGY